MNGKVEFAWHIHHNLLLEPLEEPIENRIEYIKRYKPEEQQELRLRLLKPVAGELPPRLAKAGEAYSKAGEAYSKAQQAYYEAQQAYGKAYDKAGKAYDKAWEAYSKAQQAYYEAARETEAEVEALHKIECPDCPWDGKSIFSKKDER